MSGPKRQPTNKIDDDARLAHLLLRVLGCGALAVLQILLPLARRGLHAATKSVCQALSVAGPQMQSVAGVGANENSKVG